MSANGQLFDAPTGGTLLVATSTVPATGSGPWTATVYFQPNADFFGPTSFTYSAFDGDVNDPTPATASISITAVNDPPVNTVGGPVAVNEDTPIVLTGISVFDVDSDPALQDITVHLSVNHGTLVIRTDVAGGITAADITGGGNSTNGVTLTATQNQINATLGAANGLTYQGDLNFNGADALTVSTFDGVNTSAATFAAKTDYTVAAGPAHLISANLNGDNRPDLIDVSNPTGQVSVRLNNGDGTFGSETLLTAGTNVSAVVAADINGDTKMDLVVANYATGGASAGSVGVFYGDGLGGFGAMQTVAAGVQSAYDVVTGDFNHDGITDILVDRRDYGIVGVILQQPIGTFAAPVYYTASTPNYTKSIITGDFNNDGNADIVAFNPGNKATGNPPGTVSMLLGNADGTFQTAGDIATTATDNPWEGVAADLNGDGNLDLAFTTLGTNKGVTVMLGNGNGTFGAGVFTSLGATAATGIAAADVNGDGRPDLIVTVQGSPGAAMVLRGNGNGTFQAAVALTAVTNPESVAIADFDGDGDNDIAVDNTTSNNISVFLSSITARGDIDTRVINVAAVNDAPTAAATSGSGAEDATSPARIAVTLSGSDVDTGDAVVSFSIETLAANGQLFDVATGGSALSAGAVIPATGSGPWTATVYFQPNADWNGSTNFTYKAFDGDESSTAAATASITVTAVADIANDTATTNEDTAVNILVQGNDTFENGNHAITGTTNGANGTVAVNNNGTGGDTTDDYVVYTPNADFNGSDSFTYTITSGGVTETATVNVTINAVADIANDTATTNEDTAVNILVQGNDTFENPAHAITGTTNGANGTVSVNNNGTGGDTTDDFVVYTPTADFNGSDSFTYTITSGGVTETATVNVTINAVADIANDTATTNEDTAVNILVQGNDTFEDAGARDHRRTTNGANGTVTVNNNGTGGDTTDDYVVYTPNADFNGSDSFTYTITVGRRDRDGDRQRDDQRGGRHRERHGDDQRRHAVNILVQGNDTFENAAHAITGTTNGANGTVTVNNNGTARRHDGRLRHLHAERRLQRRGIRSPIRSPRAA